MLNHISWPQYSTAILVLTAAWYAYVALRFNLFKLKTATPDSLPAVATAPVIGSVREEPGMQALPAEELVFGSSAPDNISDQTGPADNFLTEAQTLADATANKTDFLALLELLVCKYEHDELNFQALYPQLRLVFDVTAGEWPQHPTP
ncbi:hypothetical protein [Mucilaginibacter segetis]|uniref:Uncharacterized protein n=1 Tax=Mucilaginibacter segetis TaxID=2793071 RepID=A0A934PTG4_9SPHI|nr:hypothetical protein [Mucilaginibacter segetis]MBK0379291.1 hypothetical protein [Mucilaginibacter segetis]